MKKFLFLTLSSMILSIPLASQDKDEDEYKSSKDTYWNRVKLGGAGGVTPMVGMFDNKEIDKFLLSAGMPTLGSDPFYMVGGEGYGYIMFLRNVRMGGFGTAGSVTVNSIQPVTGGGNLKKEVEYRISYGGFLIDYVQPVAHKVDIAIGGSIGGGEINITMRRDDGSFKKWSDLWNDFGNPNTQSTNYTRQLSGSFVVFNPHINLEYTLLTWLQLRIGAGYPIMFSPEWKLDEKHEIVSVPAKMKAEGYTINAGIMFGYFGW